LVRRLRSWLESSRAPIGIVLAAVVVALPSLGNGLSADDHWHRIMLTHDPEWPVFAKQRWYELFTFYDGDVARTHAVIDRGVATWWTDPNLTIAFFRPVSAATHAIDYALWPSHPLLMHAHSIAWYAALVAVAGFAYRRVMARRGPSPSAGWVAGLAALLYALDHAHGIPIAWIANRNAIVAASFALGSLAAHDIAVREPAPHRRGRAGIVSCVLFALALGSGEGALAVVGYFVAYAIYLDDRAWRTKLVSFAPHGTVAALWALVYRAGGFGVRGSGMYIEPLREPAQFLAAVAKHVPLLAAADLGLPGVDLYLVVPLAVKIGLFVSALLFLAWGATAIVRLWRVEPVARFFVVGSLLATLPATAIFPSGRLLLVPGFGLIGLAALLGSGVLEGASWVPATGSARWLARSFAIWTCGGHLLLSPLALQITMQQLVTLDRVAARFGRELPTSPTPTLKRIVFVNAPDTMFTPYICLARNASGEAGPPRLPARLLTLAGGAREVDLRRTDEHTLIVRASGGFYRTGTELVTRNEDVPMRPGTKVVLTDVTIEILDATAEGIPTEASFRFDEPADSDAYLWQRWYGPRLVAVKPPPVGEHVTIPGQPPQLY
jgi:hypothetical protein